MAGIALGVLALVLVMSVMDGFEGILKQRILGAVPHIIITPDSNTKSTITDNQSIDSAENLSVKQFTDFTANTQIEQDIVQVLPLVQSVAIMQLPSDLKGVMAQGISDKNAIPVGVKHSLTSQGWAGFLQKNTAL